MANLGCSVQTCAHNSSGLCSLGCICVGGESAHTSSETCCKSFQTDKTATNCIRSANATVQTDIKCAACKCSHNSGCTCTADSVDVKTCGCSTQCKTFQE